MRRRRSRRQRTSGAPDRIEPVLLPPAEAIAALAALHGARWRARGQGGVLTDERRALLGDAAAALGARDELLGVGVRLGGELAAIALVLLEPRHERRGPGTLAIASAIEEAHRRGARLFDSLRGGEPYKYRFGAIDGARLRRRVIRRRAT